MAAANLFATRHLEYRQDHRRVGYGLLLQELDEGLRYRLVDLRRLSLVARVSPSPETNQH